MEPLFAHTHLQTLAAKRKSVWERGSRSVGLVGGGEKRLCYLRRCMMHDLGPRIRGCQGLAATLREMQRTSRDGSRVPAAGRGLRGASSIVQRAAGLAA